MVYNLVYISFILDFEQSVRSSLEESGAQIDLTVVGSTAEARSSLDGGTVDCLLSEYPVRDADTRAFLDDVGSRDEPPPVVVISADNAAIDDAVTEGVADFVPASLLAERPDVLASRVLGAVECARTERAGTDREIGDRDQREHGYAAVVDNFPNGAVTFVDRDCRYRLAGGQLFDDLPNSPSNVVGSDVGDVGPGDRGLFVETYRKALGGTETATETTVAGKTLIHRTVPVYDNGIVTGAIGMTQDVTVQRERERKLERNRQFLSDIQSVADIGGWEVDLRSETHRWTDEVYRIHEVSRDDQPTVEQGLDFYHPDDRDTIERAYDELIDEGEPYDLELRIETTTDEVRWVRTRGEPWTDDEGNIVGARGTFQDITARKERERELRRKSRAIEAAPIGIVITDPSQDDNPLTYVNQTFLDTSGYRSEEVLGRNCRLMQGEDTDPETVATIREAIDAGEAVSAELLNYRNDGSEFWNHLEIAPVRDDGGELLNFVGFQRDVTDRVEYERELEESRNRYRTLVENFPNGAVALVDRALRYRTVGGAPIDEAREEGGSLEGELVEEALTDEMAAALIPEYKGALDGEQRTFEANFGDTVYRFRIVPVRDDDGSVFAAMGVSQDVTELKERQRALEKREVILRQLHVATRELYPPNSMDEVASFVVDFLTETFEFSYVSLKRFDEQEGVLRPAAKSSPPGEGIGLGTIEPGDDALWNVYRTGESRTLAGEELDGAWYPADMAISQCLVVPVGDFGLVVVTVGDDEFDDVDRDMVEVLATNAQAVFQNLQHDHERDRLVGQVDAQKRRLDDLRSVVDAVQSVQRRVAESESRDELEVGVCEELIETDHLDFAWIGRPQSSDGDLKPTAWAGDQSGYLDSVLPDADGVSLPAQHAATRRAPYHIPSISRQVGKDAWAKDALAAQFHSVLSMPLIYDDVLYGVLTVYSSVEDGFEQHYEDLVRDAASLVIIYSRILEQRYPGSDREYVELEFELADPTYPPQRLAAETGCQIRYDTVTETAEATVRLLVTVLEGDPAAVLDRARSVPTIVEAMRFGDDDSRRLRLTVERPFLASDVANHGGRLLDAVSDETGTRIRIELPGNASKRPLLDALATRYRDIDMVAQRQTTRDTPTADTLTDRQYDILNAAYHGGYYETPRDVTGEDLAEAFDISGPALYNHLQEAHRKVFEQFLEGNPNIKPDSNGLKN